MPVDMKPTVGRMVYYKTRGSADGMYPSVNFAAIITNVESNGDTGLICLAVFGPQGLRFELGVEQGQEIGQWDWMPFQKDQQARLAKESNV